MPNGQTIKVSSSESELEGADYLYRTAIVRYTGLKNIATGEIKDMHLINAKEAPPGIDESALQRLWEAGRRAWSDVANPTEWLENLRGY